MCHAAGQLAGGSLSEQGDGSQRQSQRDQMRPAGAARHTATQMHKATLRQPQTLPTQKLLSLSRLPSASASLQPPKPSQGQKRLRSAGVVLGTWISPVLRLLLLLIDDCVVACSLQVAAARHSRLSDL